MPLMQTSGNVTADAYAGGAAVVPTYIEDVFVSWLSTGNGASRTVTGPDMTKGGLSITKSRSAATGWHYVDTVRGAGNSLSSNTTSGNTVESTGVTAFTTTGTSIGAASEYNTNGATYVDYLIRKQPKFFDVVTFSTDGSGAATFNHTLGSVPGCVIIKRTGGAEAWYVYHRGLTSSATQRYVQLNTTGAETNVGFDWISVSSTSCSINGLFAASSAYVAYIFAHNAGGFGLTGTDNVISCGSFTTDGSGNATVNLGYEPQWLTVKASSTTGNWFMRDNMRGWITETAVGTSAALNANLSNAEALGGGLGLSATGFVAGGLSASTTYIYIAIRRGPMKVPTDGTKVFLPYSSASTTVDGSITTGFPVDLMFSGQKNSNNSGDNWSFVDRLRGLLVSGNATSGALKLLTTSTAAEASLTYPNAYNWWNTGVVQGYGLNGASVSYQFFRRAPGFFDEVCYTGTGSAPTLNHNLGVTPELIINKSRATGSWFVYQPSASANYGLLNTTNAFTGPVSVSATATTYVPISYASGVNFVSYLFASCPGVSKVGSYTGNGSTQTIDCGFTGGARFVLIKRTDSTGDWYVYDTARGMTTLTDPYLRLNSTAAETATLGSVTTVSTGFAVNAAILAAINTNAATYIYLAIA